MWLNLVVCSSLISFPYNHQMLISIRCSVLACGHSSKCLLKASLFMNSLCSVKMQRNRKSFDIDTDSPIHTNVLWTNALREESKAPLAGRRNPRPGACTSSVIYHRRADRVDKHLLMVKYRAIGMRCDELLKIPTANSWGAIFSLGWLRNDIAKARRLTALARRPSLDLRAFIE